MRTLLALALSAAVIPLGAASNGKTVRAHVGDVLVVTLAANASTGYGWHVARTGAPVLKAVSTRYTEPKRAKPIVGAPGTYTARVAVRAAGRARLVLVYRRSTGPAARTWAVTVLAR